MWCTTDRERRVILRGLAVYPWPFNISLAESPPRLVEVDPVTAEAAQDTSSPAIETSQAVCHRPPVGESDGRTDAKGPSAENGRPFNRALRRGLRSLEDYILADCGLKGPLGAGACSGRFRAVKPSMTSDQPLSSISMPTKRPITQRAEIGHRRQMRTPNKRETTPSNSTQRQCG